MKSKNRSALSFSILFLFIAGVIFSLRAITSEKVDGAYRAHRRSFEVNEALGKILHSNKRLSVRKEVPPGKPIRINGYLGLRSQKDLMYYKIKIESGEKSFSITPGDLYVLPKVSHTTDFRCIEGWSEETQYAGARFSDFMDYYKIGKKPDGSYYQYVALETPDQEYYVSLDMESMLHPQTLLAYEMNLKPLAIANGFPVRLFIPIKYGIKSLKRVGRIYFSDERPRDYWAERGYDWYSGL